MFGTLVKVLLSVLSTLISFPFRNSSTLLISVSTVQFELFPLLLNEINHTLFTMQKNVLLTCITNIIKSLCLRDIINKFRDRR